MAVYGPIPTNPLPVPLPVEPDAHGAYQLNLLYWLTIFTTDSSTLVWAYTVQWTDTTATATAQILAVRLMFTSD